MLPDSVYHIYGHLSPDEMQLLYELASAVPQGGVIVEIGSFQGKSAVCLGLGAKESEAKVYTIDPHEEIQVNNSTRYGMENHAALLMNLCLQGVADIVRVVSLFSMQAFEAWNLKVDLLWIDGSHEYWDAACDIENWSKWAERKGCKMAIHDTSGHYPGVTRALQEFTMNHEDWAVVQMVDSTTVLEYVYG